VRYYRHGDEFWLDLIARWKASGIGVRKFCEQNGVATSIFHKRRADLAKCAAAMPKAASVITPDACFIPVLSDSMIESVPPVTPPAVAVPAKSAVRDSVVISSGGMRMSTSMLWLVNIFSRYDRILTDTSHLWS
jgi:hypothetical protein